MICKIIKRCSSSSVSGIFSDLVICGGGLIGTTVAATLAKNPTFNDKTFTLIESKPVATFTDYERMYSNRVSALSPFSKSLFERLGVWKRVRRFKEVNKLRIWGVYSDNYLELNNNEDVVAYIVENDELVEAITQEIRSLGNVKLVYGKNIAAIQASNLESSLPTVTLDDGSQYSCQLLLGCDGTDSKVRKVMGVNYLSWNYHQMAVVATLHVTVGSNNIAWQKFLPDGPLALLPLTNELSSLVWSTTKEKALHLLNISKDNFVDALNCSLSSKNEDNQFVDIANKGINTMLNSFGLSRTGKLSELPPVINDVQDGTRAAFPLGFGHSSDYAASNIVLVGDAAHRVHPLAGQGVNLGFQDIVHLENVLSDACKNGRDLGEIEVLKKYESLCQLNNVPVMAFIELIHRVYTSPFSPVQALGDIGLKFANILDPIKRQINKGALFQRT